MEKSDRRGFLRQLAGELARTAKEVAPAIPLASVGNTLALPQPSSGDPSPATPLACRWDPVGPAARCVSEQELVALATEVGLSRRLTAVQALARRSLRLTPAPAGTGTPSHAGGTPALPPDTPWPQWNGAPLTHLATINLDAAPDDTDRQPPLPAGGNLLVFYATRDAPSGLSTGHAGAVAVRFSATELADAGLRGGQTTGCAVTLSAERTLPRVWSTPVEQLALDTEEQRHWQELRQRLAALQDVALADETETSETRLALHRMLGHPDERRGEMPLICEAAARDIDLAEQPPYTHPASKELAHGAGRWRLLFQLSGDDPREWPWRDLRRRLYLWIDEDDLRAHDFSRVWAIPQ